MNLKHQLITIHGIAFICFITGYWSFPCGRNTFCRTPWSPCYVHKLTQLVSFWTQFLPQIFSITNVSLNWYNQLKKITITMYYYLVFHSPLGRNMDTNIIAWTKTRKHTVYTTSKEASNWNKDEVLYVTDARVGPSMIVLIKIQIFWQWNNMNHSSGRNTDNKFKYCLIIIVCGGIMFW